MSARWWPVAVMKWLAAGVLNAAAGWAVAALFGPLPDPRRRTVLAAVVLAAGVWLAAAGGILVFPVLASWLWRLAGAPEVFDVAWLRLALTAAVALLPAVAGLLALTLSPGDARPRSRALLRAVVLGYPLTVGLALTLPLLAVFLPALWLRDRRRGWSVLALPVQTHDAGRLVQTVHDRLHDAGWHLTGTPPPAMLRLPYTLAGVFGRGSLGGLLAGQLPSLRGSDLEVVFYPLAVAVHGTASQRTQARAVVFDALTPGAARLTWTAMGRRFEERLTALWQIRPADKAAPDSLRALAELAQVRAAARSAALPVAEWETVDRLCLRVERDLLLAALHAAAVPDAVPAPVSVAPVAAALSISAPVLPPAPVPGVPAATAPTSVVQSRGLPMAPASSASPAGISPAALAATLAAAAVVFWRMTAEPSQAEAAGEA